MYNFGPFTSRSTTQSTTTLTPSTLVPSLPRPRRRGPRDRGRGVWGATQCVHTARSVVGRSSSTGWTVVPVLCPPCRNSTPCPSHSPSPSLRVVHVRSDTSPTPRGSPGPFGFPEVPQGSVDGTVLNVGGTIHSGGTVNQGIKRSAPVQEVTSKCFGVRGTGHHCGPLGRTYPKFIPNELREGEGTSTRGGPGP